MNEILCKRNILVCKLYNFLFLFCFLITNIKIYIYRIIDFNSYKVTHVSLLYKERQL